MDVGALETCDLEAFSDEILVGFLRLSTELDVFFFLSVLELEPGDCSIPWQSTAPPTVTEDRSLREELCESFVGVSLVFLRGYQRNAHEMQRRNLSSQTAIYFPWCESL